MNIQSYLALATGNNRGSSANPSGVSGPAAQGTQAANTPPSLTSILGGGGSSIPAAPGPAGYPPPGPQNSEVKGAPINAKQQNKSASGQSGSIIIGGSAGGEISPMLWIGVGAAFLVVLILVLVLMRR